MWNPALTNNMTPVPSLRELLVHLLDQVVDHSSGKLEGLTFFGLCDIISLLKDPESYPLVNDKRMAFHLVCETRNHLSARGKRLKIQSGYPVVEIFLADSARNLPSRLLVEAKLGDQKGPEWIHHSSAAMVELFEFSRDMDNQGCTIWAF